jgi:subtilisin family serine protease
MRVLVQLRPTEPTVAALGSGEPTAAVAESLPEVASTVDLDLDYDPEPIPAPEPAEPDGDPFDLAQPLGFSFAPERAAPVVRGILPDATLGQRVQALTANPDVVGVFSDPFVERCAVCPQKPVGSDRDVARELGVNRLEQKGLTGRGVPVAVVDSGINVQHLRHRGQDAKLDRGRSYVPRHVDVKPGEFPLMEDLVHGTMCAYDVGIAAPKATLLDYAVLLARPREDRPLVVGLLSEAVKAYGKLLRMIRDVPENRRRLVVTNSWGLYSPKWDFPKDRPGNYSDNPSHPFNVIVASLERAGADILFAAGNCGPECPSWKCEYGPKQRTIGGANSHPRVLCVAGVDHKRRLVGYSSAGPGRLSSEKPDIAAYTEFKGSLVAAKDDGTSAACPVAAGVIAAIRTRYSAKRVSPKQLRTLACRTARDLGGQGYDYRYGWGAIDPPRLVEKLANP